MKNFLNILISYFLSLKNNINPVGTILTFAGNTIPTGYLLCDGQAVSRTTYAKLYSVIGDTYGAGDGTTTFNLPNLIDKFVEGSNTAGTEIDAGLPNIEGKLYYTALASTATRNNNALIGIPYDYASIVYKLDKTGYTMYTWDLDASKSNPIYGNSTTVQPQSLTMKMIIKY